MGIFDPNAFMNEVELDANPETEFPKVPAGTYEAEVNKVSIRDWSGEKDGESYTVYYLDVLWKFTDSAVGAEYGVEYVKHSEKLDVELNGDNFALAKGPGKNIGLGRLQAALGLTGKKGLSFNDFVGQRALVNVTVDTKGYNKVKSVQAVD